MYTRFFPVHKENEALVIVGKADGMSIGRAICRLYHKRTLFVFGAHRLAGDSIKRTLRNVDVVVMDEPDNEIIHKHERKIRTLVESYLIGDGEGGKPFKPPWFIFRVNERLPVWCYLRKESVFL